MSTMTPGPLPLIVGVTGHRDLRAQDLPTLSGVLRGQIAAIQLAWPHTPLVMLSPLAEGADRLAASIALDMGARLVVPLPMPRALYEQDFTAAGSRDEFRSLLARADNDFELPLVEGNTLAGISHEGKQRDLQYAQVGIFVTRHSQIVIALWNGKTTDCMGGTSQIVGYRLNGGAPVLLTGNHQLLDPEERGPVVHILCPRVRDPEVTGGEPFSVRHLYPGGPEEEEGLRRMYERRLARIEQFNADAVARDREAGAPPADVLKDIVPEGTCTDDTRVCRLLMDLYAKADRLAIDYQTKHVRTVAAIILFVVMGALGLGFFDCYGGLPIGVRIHCRWLPIVVFFLFFGLTVAWWDKNVRRHAVQSRYLDYRALAEGIRVQHYWNIAEVPESVADHYLGKQVGELAWIRNAIRTYADVLGARTGGRRACRLSLPLQDRLALVNRAWVGGQAAYFARKVRPKKEKERVFMTLAKILGVLSVLTVVPLLGIVLFNPNDTLEQMLLYECAMCGVLAAALTTYVKVMAFDAEALQYQRMSRVFNRANSLIAAALAQGDVDQAKQLLTLVGNEALAENGDWVLTHRERPLDVPGVV